MGGGGGGGGGGGVGGGGGGGGVGGGGITISITKDALPTLFTIIDTSTRRTRLSYAMRDGMIGNEAICQAVSNLASQTIR